MSNKNEWSKVDYPNLRKFKKFKKKNRDKFNRKEAEMFFKYDKGLIDFQSFREYEIIKCLLDGYRNYYIESVELFDFLCSAKVGEKTKEEIRIMMTKIYDMKEPAGVRQFISSAEATERIVTTKEPTYSLSGCIHSKGLKRSLLFNVQSCSDYVSVLTTNGMTVSFTGKDWDSLNRDGLSDQKQLKPVINLLYYMSAFPEYVLDTPPNECIDKLNENNSKTIRISKEIADYLHETRDVSPHLRRGHFRYLSSDRFKNKKGQCVFVKPSFVKGNAKTIIDGGNI